MFQRSRKGYIEEMIEKLAEVIAFMLTAKNSGRYEAALARAADECKQMTGLNIATLRMLLDTTLVNLVSMGGGLDAGRCFLAGRLLEAQAQIYETQSRTVAAHVSLHKALVLLTEALRHDAALRSVENRALIEEILARLSGYDLPDDLQARIAAYRQSLGDFPSALCLGSS